MLRVKYAKIEVTFADEPKDLDAVKQEILELTSPELNVINVQLDKSVYYPPHTYSAEIDLSDYANGPDEEEDPKEQQTCEICFAMPGMHADTCPEQTMRNPERPD